MQYYFAPMEGLTDAVCRRTHCRFYPGEGQADRYYLPFVSPTKENALNPRKQRDLLPENNEGVPAIPQVLCKDAAVFLRFAKDLAAMGYREVNLNLGCPSGTVVAKGKGAGMLRDPDALDYFLDQVFSGSPEIKVSVKTRLGLRDPEEFDEILAVLDRYPICELTIHPRTQKAFYVGPVNLPVFERALAHTHLPVCYNGSLATAAGCQAFGAQHPSVKALMLGRGLIANPALLRQLRGGAPADRTTMQAYFTALYEEYARVFDSQKNAVRRMKNFWFYAFAMFAGPEKERFEKQMKRVSEPWEYTALCNQVFTRLAFSCDADAAQWERPLGG